MLHCQGNVPLIGPAGVFDVITVFLRLLTVPARHSFVADRSPISSSGVAQTESHRGESCEIITVDVFVQKTTIEIALKPVGNTLEMSDCLTVSYQVRVGKPNAVSTQEQVELLFQLQLTIKGLLYISSAEA